MPSELWLTCKVRASQRWRLHHWKVGCDIYLASLSNIFRPAMNEKDNCTRSIAHANADRTFIVIALGRKRTLRNDVQNPHTASAHANRSGTESSSRLVLKSNLLTSFQHGEITVLPLMISSMTEQKPMCSRLRSSYDALRPVHRAVKSCQSDR